jgi:hypothetical protein
MKRRRLAGALALMLTVIGLSPTNAAKDPWLTGPFSGCVNEPINSADWALMADPHGDFTKSMVS